MTKTALERELAELKMTLARIHEIATTSQRCVIITYAELSKCLGDIRELSSGVRDGK